MGGQERSTRSFADMDAMDINPQTILFFPVLIFSLVCHEVGHAWVAWKAGDDTARLQGRITLNPLAHLDPIGTVLIPLLQIFTSIPLIGWAKPVPINPGRFRSGIWKIYVALAGVTANLALVLLSTLALRIYIIFDPDFLTRLTLARDLSINHSVQSMLIACVAINLSLFIFNLLPVPPLDGSHILMYFVRDLDSPLGRVFLFLERFGFFILFGLLYFGILGKILIPVFWFAVDVLLVIFFFPKGIM